MTSELPKTTARGTAFGLVVRAAACLCAAIFTGFALMAVHELAHSLTHSHRPMSWIAAALHDGTPLPVLIPTGIVVYSLVGAWLRRRDRTRCAGRAEPHSPSPVAFLTGASSVLLLLGLFWAWEGRHLAGYHSPYAFTIYAIDSATLGTGLVLGILAAVLSARGLRGGRGLALATPLGVIAALTALAEWMESGYPSRMALWPSIPRVAFALVEIAIVGLLCVLAERRLFRRWNLSMALIHSALWLLAGFLTLMVLTPGGHMCVTTQPNPVLDAERHVLSVVVAVAIVARVAVHLQRMKARGNEAG